MSFQYDYCEYTDTQAVEVFSVFTVMKMTHFPRGQYICGLLLINPPFLYLRLICFKTSKWNCLTYLYFHLQWVKYKNKS